MSDYWNSWGDTAKRLFVPFGVGSDREKSPIWDLGGRFTADPGAKAEAARKELLYDQSKQAGTFADQSEKGFGALGQEASAQREYLRRLAAGQDSIAAEQLRQGLQAQQAQQASMAASAPPSMQPLAARTAMIQAGRASSGMSGQAALAGLQERQGAQRALSEMILQQRQQDLQASLGGRQTAVQGYGANNAGTPEKSAAEKYGPAIVGGLAALFSDRRLKQDIDEVSDEDARSTIKKLRGYAFRYKDQRHGKGRQVGVMAQDLERAGLRHAVADTPEGKVVDGARLSTANTALIAALGRRLDKLERSNDRGR